MNLLLDTHIALWWFADSPRVTTPVREAVRDADRVVVSVASVWEIMIKQALGKLDAPVNILHALNKSGFGTYRSRSPMPLPLAAFPRTIEIRLTECWWLRPSVRI